MPDDILLTRAARSDIPAIAAVFTESFYDSVIHHCGHLPKPQAMEDVFGLVYEAEPDAAFIAKEGGQVVGYCFAPARLHSLWVRAVVGGHILKWAWRWLNGRYGFGLYPVKMILMNKFAFLRSSLKPQKAADARILSIAVAPSHRGRSIATALMKEALHYFRTCQVGRVRLEVRPDNLPAVRVYRKLGFADGGRTVDLQGEWLIMYKEMDDGNV